MRAFEYNFLVWLKSSFVIFWARRSRLVFKLERIESYQKKITNQKMFNRHAILALAAISTEALKLEQAIAGGEGTGTPMQELSVDLDMPIAGGEGTGTPMQELSVELAQVVRNVS